jgi:hypothetical protein
MKRKEFERLLGIFDQKDQSPVDFSGFSDPAEARKSYDDLRKFSGTLSGYEKYFSPFFTNRVMGRINNLAQSPGLEEYLSMQFSRVMTFGLTAVILVFLALYIFQGQEGFGTLLGTDRSNDINFISYLFYEF